jgi:hypothetical protein
MVKLIQMNVACLLLAFTVGVVAWVLYWFQRDSVDVMPIPVVKSGQPHVSLEWVPTQVESGRRKLNPDTHPGHVLAVQHCTGCHLLPSPQQLPRDAWPFVLTWMFNYLGYTNIYGPFQNNVERLLIPAVPAMNEKALQSLAEYYLLFAPRSGGARTHVPTTPHPRMHQFLPQAPPMSIPPDETVTLTHWDATRQAFYVGRGTQRALQVFDPRGRMLLNKACASEPVDVSPLSNGFRLTLLGDFLEDRQQGEVLDVMVSQAGQLQSRTLVEGYHRLTQTISRDLDLDGHEDLLLVGFGAGVVGKVSILWGDATGTFSRSSVLLTDAGALNARIHDMDGDGRLDILVLVAQRHQALMLFRQSSDGSFTRQILIEKGAGFGYNYFDLVDWNQDDLVDLLLVNGNNMEIRNAPLKPYHGIRILLQDQGMVFREALFHPMHGAMKALAEDFDLDGDLDLAAIAFYPDWSLENPITFLYLENRGAAGLQASSPMVAHWGRWLTMGSGDVNRDGYPDILLGGAYVKHGVHDDYRDRYEALPHPSMMVLMNAGEAAKR